MGVEVRQLPQRDDGVIPLDQRVRAQSEIGPTTYMDGRVIVAQETVVSVVPIAPVEDVAPVEDEQVLPPSHVVTGIHRGKSKR